MSKLLALSLAAPFILIGAAHPGPDSHPTSSSPEAGPLTYRPCRPGPGDDRCIQLYERGVRASYAAWQRQGGARARLAMGGPDEAPTRRVIVRQHADHHGSGDHGATRVIVVPRAHAAPRGHHMAEGARHRTPAPNRERMAHAGHDGGHEMHRCHEAPRVREAPRMREAPHEEGGARGM